MDPLRKDIYEELESAFDVGGHRNFGGCVENILDVFEKHNNTITLEILLRKTENTVIQYARPKLSIKQVEDFYLMLQGKDIDSDGFSLGHKFNLTPNKAFTIIWYLQEILKIIPDRFEKCDVCKELYNSYSSGHYSEKKGKHYCDSCDTFEDE